MRAKIMATICSLAISLLMTARGQVNSQSIEVTGTATINIVPDRITVEIGMEEYYKKKLLGDSMIVKLSEIEGKVRATLTDAGVPDSMIIVTDMGNYRDRGISTNFLMAKRLSATVTNFNQIEKISENLERRGVTSFNIVKVENSEIDRYNREGLSAALEAARDKAAFIAKNAGGSHVVPWEITEIGAVPYDAPAFSNVTFDSGGSGMDNMRRIVRRYSVRVRYLFTTQ